MARGIKKLKKWTTISVLLSSARYAGISLMVQTLQERVLTQQQRMRYEGREVSLRPYGRCVFSFLKYRWGDEQLSLGREYGVHRNYKLALDTPSKRYARGKVVFKNEDSDA